MLTIILIYMTLANNEWPRMLSAMITSKKEEEVLLWSYLPNQIPDTLQL